MKIIHLISVETLRRGSLITVGTFILKGSFPQVIRPGNTFHIKSVIRSRGYNIFQTDTGPLTPRHGWKKSFSDFSEGC